MMIRVVSMAYVALVAALIFGLYHVKLEARSLAREKQELSLKIDRASADIVVLQAEWAARTSPDRLKRLVGDHLPAMKPTEPMQFTSLSLVPRRAPQSDGDAIERLLSMVEPQAGDTQSLPHSRPTM